MILKILIRPICKLFSLLASSKILIRNCDGLQAVVRCAHLLVFLHHRRPQNLEFILQYLDFFSHLGCFLCAHLNQVHHLVAIILHDVVDLCKVLQSEIIDIITSSSILKRDDCVALVRTEYQRNATIHKMPKHWTYIKL